MVEHIAKKVLLVDDSDDFRALVVRFFQLLFPDDEIVEYDLSQGPPSELFIWEQYDMLLLDYNLGDGQSGLDWLRRYQTCAEFPPTLMLTGEGNEEVAVKAFQFGAQDYLRKQGLTKTHLKESIQGVLDKHEESGDMINTIGLSNHIFNKSKFLSKLNKLAEKDLAILIEIDKFQSLRDEHGMMVTDRIGAYLSTLVNKLLEEAGTQHSIIRIGDSSIAGNISSYDQDDGGRKLAESLVEGLNGQPYVEGKLRIEFTVSIGVICNTRTSINIDTILAHLDDACLKARNKEGNSWHIYDAPGEQEAEQDHALKQQIIDAFRDGRVVPNYQPLIKISEVETELSSLYMIRVRLRSEEGATITPLEFMPTVRTNKLKSNLDRWVIESSLQTLQSLQEQNSNPDQGLMVTLTEDSLIDKDLPDWLKQEAEKLGNIDLLKSLIFKMPTQKFLEHEKKALFLMRHIRETLGIGLALDNVQDAASITNPAKLLKLNYIMFSPCVDNEELVSDEEVSKIVSLAHENSAFAVANKLESNDYLTKMIMAGVDFVSGHFIQAPAENLVFTEEHEI